MKRLNQALARSWSGLAPRFLPFSDIDTAELPLTRLLRLSLFQVSVGMAVVLLIGTLNRVMIVELGVSAWLVGVMVALPLFFAPLRALIGHRSDMHRSVLGWRRVPYIWMGTLLQFGGLAIMPFALIVLSGDSDGPAWVGQAAAALAFLLVGAGLHTTQTVGLALATDLAPPHVRPRVVALLCMMLLLGMLISAVAFALLLTDFSQLRLIQVVQGAAVATMLLNVVALWKQEARNPKLTSGARPEPEFRKLLAEHCDAPGGRRRLLATALGTAGFGMQDILLEPYGGQVLGLSVASTTALTAVLAAAGIAGLALAARALERGVDPHRMSGYGVLAGLAAFVLVMLAAPIASAAVLALGVVLIGFGGGLFAHGTLTAAMNSAQQDNTGFALGVWGAVQATAAGLAVASGGIIRDVSGELAHLGWLGPALMEPSVGYGVVYFIELVLLFTALVVIGPLVQPTARWSSTSGGSVATQPYSAKLQGR